MYSINFNDGIKSINIQGSDRDQVTHLIVGFFLSINTIDFDDIDELVDFEKSVITFLNSNDLIFNVSSYQLTKN